MSQTWYVARSRTEKEGPYTTAQMADLARAGRLRPSDIVRRADANRWGQAGDFPEFFEGSRGRADESPSGATTFPPPSRQNGSGRRPWRLAWPPSRRHAPVLMIGGATVVGAMVLTTVLLIARPSRSPKAGMATAPSPTAAEDGGSIPHKGPRSPGKPVLAVGDRAREYWVTKPVAGRMTRGEFLRTCPVATLDQASRPTKGWLVYEGSRPLWYYHFLDDKLVKTLWVTIEAPGEFRALLGEARGWLGEPASKTKDILNGPEEFPQLTWDLPEVDIRVDILGMWQGTFNERKEYQIFITVESIRGLQTRQERKIEK